MRIKSDVEFVMRECLAYPDGADWNDDMVAYCGQKRTLMQPKVTAKHTPTSLTSRPTLTPKATRNRLSPTPRRSPKVPPIRPRSTLSNTLLRVSRRLWLCRPVLICVQGIMR